MITIDQAAQLLAFIQGRDHRTVGEVDIVVWADDLSDLDYDECVDAIRAHFRDTTRDPNEWITPVHVRRRVQHARAEAAEHAHNQQLRAEIDAAADIDKDAAHRAYLEARRAFAHATGRPAPVGWNEYGDCPWPSCHAHPGEPCTTNGHVRTSPHPSRSQTITERTA